MNVRYMLLILLLVSAWVCDSPRQKEERIDLATVPRLDVERYMGRWYEIARLPHVHERGLHSISVEYALREDGTIGVVNSGWKSDDSLKEAHGKAYRPDESRPGELKVSFFWIFYGDYLVLELDEENYSYAMVSSGRGTNLWILSRTSKMSRDTLDELLSRAEKRGFQLEQLIFVEHKKNDLSKDQM